MNVLITGAAGFLGRHFHRHHVDAGDHVLAVDDLSAAHAAWASPLHTLVMEAGRFFDEWDDGDISPDLVYHFAAPVGGRERIEHDPMFDADSLRLDSALFRWASRHTKATIVYPSSSAVYGVVRQSDPFSPPLEERMFSPADREWQAPDLVYGYTKMTGEILAWTAARYGVRTLCIRPFSGYGEDQSMDYPVPAICGRVARREDPLLIWGSGMQRRDFIHVDDVVGATIARLAAGITGYASMNIGSGRATSFMALAHKAARVAGYDPLVMTDVSKPQGVESRYCDPSRMLRYYTPRVTLEDGLRRVIEAQS